MYYDIFKDIRQNLEKDNTIPTRTILSLNPSSQSCYDTGVQVGTCVRQIWLDKTDQIKTNPLSLKAKMSGFSGNWWETWFINKIKELGYYHNSQFPATDPQHLVKGIVDLSFINPHTNLIELGEIKTYDGSNYKTATSILGNTKVAPKPNTKHLLQAFRYSLIFKDQIKTNNLFYIDRACGDWYKYKQFKIELIELNDNIYPKIITIWNDKYYEYIEKSISSLGIYLAEEILLNHFSTGTVPQKDFVEEYDLQTIIELHSKQEIPEYLYNHYKKDPINNKIGSVACRYCPFAKGTCSSYD